MLALSEGDEAVETNPLETFKLAVCNEIIDLVERQNVLVKECIRKSTMTQVDGALRVWQLPIQCELLAKVIRTEDFASERKERKHEDLTLLLASLTNLSACV